MARGYSSERMVLRTVSLPPEIDQLLREHSFATGRTKNDIIRDAVIVYLAERRAEKEAENAAKPVRPKWLTEAHLSLLQDHAHSDFFYVNPDNIIRVADLFKHGYVELQPDYEGLEVHFTDLSRALVVKMTEKTFIKTAGEVSKDIEERIQYWKDVRKNSFSEPDEVNQERIDANARIEELQSLRHSILKE